MTPGYDAKPGNWFNNETCIKPIMSVYMHTLKRLDSCRHREHRAQSKRKSQRRSQSQSTRAQEHKSIEHTCPAASLADSQLLYEYAVLYEKILITNYWLIYAPTLQAVNYLKLALTWLVCASVSRFQDRSK